MQTITHPTLVARLGLVLVLVLMAIATSASTESQPGLYRLTLVAGGHDTFGRGEAVAGDLIVCGGYVAANEGARVAGALLFAAVAYLVTLRLLGPVDRIARAAAEHAAASTALGLLASIVVASLLVLLVFTVVLAPVAFLGAVLCLSPRPMAG